MAGYFHHPKDGRGQRRVTVNGEEVRFVAAADTRLGAAWYYPQPTRFTASGKPILRVKYGAVVVEQMGACNGPSR